ncbi:MAG: PAS domain S-box protein [Balneolaceae bacterium]|nr:PAS domain S-box protein [Balneolaceae bacterium]MDR9446593.1 PAS domain S-box protein [Balneolaceae bacterium]
MSETLKNLLESTIKDEAFLKDATQLIDDLQTQLETVTHRLELLEKAISTDYDSIVITEVDLDKPGPRIVYVNDGFTRMTGYSREEAIGQTPRMLQGEKTDPEVLRVLREKLHHGQSFFGHTVNYRKDGSEFINQWDIHPIFDDAGDLAYWVSYQHDISQRKQSELTLMDADLEFDDLFEESKRVSVDVDIQGNVLSANKMFRDMTGLDADQLKEIKVWDIFEAGHSSALKEAFSGGNGVDVSGEFKLGNVVKKDIDVVVSSRNVGGTDQEVIRLLLQNKSAQSKIMEALGERSAWMGSLFGTPEHVEYRYPLEALHGDEEIKDAPTFSGDALEKVFGEEASALRAAGLYPHVHEDDRQGYLSFIAEVQKGTSKTHTYRIVIGNEAVNVIDYAVPVADDSGQVLSVKGRLSKKISGTN